MKITDSPTVQRALVEAFEDDLEDLDPNSDEARGVDPDWIYDRNRSDW